MLNPQIVVEGPNGEKSWDQEELADKLEEIRDDVLTLYYGERIPTPEVNEFASLCKDILDAEAIANPPSSIHINFLGEPLNGQLPDDPQDLYLQRIASSIGAEKGRVQRAILGEDAPEDYLIKNLVFGGNAPVDIFPSINSISDPDRAQRHRVGHIGWVRELREFDRHFLDLARDIIRRNERDKDGTLQYELESRLIRDLGLYPKNGIRYNRHPVTGKRERGFANPD